MAMTSNTMTPPVPSNQAQGTTPPEKQVTPTSTAPIPTVDQLKAVAQTLAPAPKSEEADLLAGLQEEFEDEVEAEAAASAKFLSAQQEVQAGSKSISDLTEADAYNLEVGISAAANFDPNFLKVELKDPNYIARWGNRDSIRQSQLVAQGFTFVKGEEVRNLDRLDMFLDGQEHFVWADLVAMKIPKNVYYAGLRRAYLKSLHATNSKKASEAGSMFAKSNFNSTLSGAERSYVANHLDQSKPIYNPPVGV